MLLLLFYSDKPSQSINPVAKTPLFFNNSDIKEEVLTRMHQQHILSSMEAALLCQKKKAYFCGSNLICS